MFLKWGYVRVVLWINYSKKCIKTKLLLNLRIVGHKDNIIELSACPSWGRLYFFDLHPLKKPTMPRRGKWGSGPPRDPPTACIILIYCIYIIYNLFFTISNHDNKNEIWKLKYINITYIQCGNCGTSIACAVFLLAPTNNIIINIILLSAQNRWW